MRAPAPARWRSVGASVVAVLATMGPPAICRAELLPPPALTQAFQAGRWRLTWRAESGTRDYSSACPALVRCSGRYLGASLEVTYRHAGEVRGTAWRWEASARASVVDERRTVTDPLGGSLHRRDRWASAWPSRLTLAIVQRDPRHGRALETSVSLFAEASRGDRLRVGQSVEVSVSRIVDPALVAIATAVSASGPDGAALHGAGEWRIVLTDELWLLTGAGITWPLRSAGPGARIWTGIGLVLRGGTQMEATVEHLLGDGDAFALRVELHPAGTQARAGPEAPM